MVATKRISKARIASLLAASLGLVLAVTIAVGVGGSAKASVTCAGAIRAAEKQFSDPTDSQDFHCWVKDVPRRLVYVASQPTGAEWSWYYITPDGTPEITRGPSLGPDG